MPLLPLLTVLAFILLMPATALAESVDDEALRIARDLQCPVCQGLSVADSPSQLAIQMRGVIREKLQAGESSDAIMTYFMERYGEGVLMRPPGRGFTAVAWIAPYLAILVGLVVVGSVLMRRSSRTSQEDGAGAELQPYLQEVDEAFGQVRDRPLR